MLLLLLAGVIWLIGWLNVGFSIVWLIFENPSLHAHNGTIPGYLSLHYTPCLCSCGTDACCPLLLQVRTVIGFGSGKAGSHGVHGAPLGAADLKSVKTKFGFNPEEVRAGGFCLAVGIWL